MKRSVSFALLAILLLAAYVRLLPVTEYLYWGADFGEYTLLARVLADQAPLPDPYRGWGVAYPEFLGMQVLQAAVSWTGLPLEAVAVLLVPLLSALVVVPVFLIGREVVGRDAPSLVAAAIVGVASAHAYPTSHAVPGALGDLLFVSGLLLAIHLRRRPAVLGPLLLVGGALVVVHHLSSFFLLISLFMVAALRVLLRGAPFASVRREAGVLATLVTANLLYWTLLTENFRAFLGFERVPPWVTALLLLALPGLLYPLARLRARFAWRYAPSFPRPRQGWTLLGLTAAGAALLGGLFLAREIPGTTVTVSPETLLYVLPTVALFALAAPGRKHFDFLPGGGAVTGWFVALNLSWMVGGLLAPTFLIPYRHFQYLTLPLALFGGVGAWRLAVDGERVRAFAVVLAALVVLGAATAIPPREALGNHFEGTRPQGMNVVHWSASHVEGVVATDHRVSSVLFGFADVLGTWDTVSSPLYAPSFHAARDEMAAHPDGRVRYVVLDEDLVAGATLFPWDPAVPLSPEAQAKFLGPHYLKLYDDGYAQVYWVNWGTA